VKRGYPESSIWYEDPEVGGWGRSGSRRGRGELPKGPGGPVAVSPFSRRWKREEEGVSLADPEVGGGGASCQKALEARSRSALFPEDGR
jgi:hypothetical protein